MKLSRRSFIQSTAAAASLPLLSAGATALAPAFSPTWDSLVDGYRTPDWFRDAKFGIWAHWSAQCVPEAGDWYARRMNIQDSWQYDHPIRKRTS
jgi:alpha-L-fucosidase